MSSESESETEVRENRSLRTQAEIDFDSADIKTIISDVIQYVITNSQKKLPVKKANISKDCLRKRGRQFNQILVKVNSSLENYFGMRLEEVPNKTVPQYILINTLDIVEINYFEKSPEDYLLNGVLLPVLAIIFMLKGETREETIYNFLKTLGLDVENNNKLGTLNYTLKQLLTNIWVKQLYLEYYKLGEGEDAHNVFDWGFRSECEINKKSLLNFVSEIYESTPETWYEQWNMAYNIVNNEETVD